MEHKTRMGENFHTFTAAGSALQSSASGSGSLIPETEITSACHGVLAVQQEQSPDNAFVTKEQPSKSLNLWFQDFPGQPLQKASCVRLKGRHQV